MDSKKIKTFIRYDNTVPFFLVIVFVFSSGVFALTSEDVQEALAKQSSKVLTVDNTYIANINLNDYSPKVTITAVQENDKEYVVFYKFESIGIVDFVWKPIDTERELRVNKNLLGKYKDLGVYITEELKEVIAQEKQLLIATQNIEKNNVSLKTVATEYSGLIGKLLDTKTEVLPGYTPVVTAQPESTIVPVNTDKRDLSTANPNNAVTTIPVTGTTTLDTQPNTATTTEASTNVNVQVVGGDEAVLVGSTYVDKGVFVNNATLESVVTKVNGQTVSPVVLDTSTTSIYTITYDVNTDKGVFNLTRIVTVQESAPTTPEPAPVTTEPSPVSITPEPTPVTPEPVPTPVTPETAPTTPEPAPAPAPTPTETVVSN